MGAYVDANLRDAFPPLPHPMVILVTLPLLALVNSSEALVLANVNLDDFITYPSVSDADTDQSAQPPRPTSTDPQVPAGFTYLGQFIDHDLTFDRTSVALYRSVSVDELLQGRWPANDGSRDLIVLIVDNPGGQIVGFIASKAPNAEGQVTDGWMPWIDIPDPPIHEKAGPP